MIDFDKVMLDPQTGGLKPEFVPDSTTGGPATSCTRTAPAISPWEWRSTSICWRPKQQARR